MQRGCIPCRIFRFRRVGLYGRDPLNPFSQNGSWGVLHFVRAGFRQTLKRVQGDALIGLSLPCLCRFRRGGRISGLPCEILPFGISQGEHRSSRLPCEIRFEPILKKYRF